MKKLLLFFILIFSFTNITTYGQRTGAVLILKDSTRLKGLGKITAFGQVRFRKTRKDKAKLYDFAQLISVKLYEPDGTHVYVRKKVKNRIDNKILQVIEEGKVSLYRKVIQGYNFAPNANAGGNFGGGGGFSGFGNHYSISNYYVQREGENEVTHLGSTDFFSKNFKKAASAYFADCPLLVEKIQNRTYRKRDITAIVEFYNLDCE